MLGFGVFFFMFLDSTDSHHLIMCPNLLTCLPSAHHLPHGFPSPLRRILLSYLVPLLIFLMFSSPVFHIFFPPCASGSPHLPAHFQLSTILPTSPHFLSSQDEYKTFVLHHYLRLCLHFGSHCDKNTQQHQCVGLSRLSIQT